MNYRIVGIAVIVISLLIGFIIYSFNTALTDIVAENCSHGPTCAMWGTIDFQTNIGIGIMVFVLALGLILVFFGDKWFNKMPVKEKDFSKEIKDMNSEEKAVFDKIIEANGSIYQSDLVNKTGLTKVRVTRILDKLEGKALIERKRRGMTNIILIKN